MTGFSRSTLYNLTKKAIEKRYNPKILSMIYNVYIEDAQKNRRLGTSLKKKQKIVAKVTTNQYSREKSTAQITRKVEVSQSLVDWILTKYGYKKIKPI